MKINKKIPFIGGDTNSYNYDFFLKVAGSTVECPMKIYGQDVDVNMIPISKRNFKGWAIGGTTSITLTQGQEDPFSGTNGTRIQTSGGEYYSKYFYEMSTTSQSSVVYNIYVWVKVLSGSLIVGNELGSESSIITVADGWKLVKISSNGNGTAKARLKFRTINISDSLDFIAYNPILYTSTHEGITFPNVSTGWTENTTQSDLDMLKSVDGIALSKSTSTSGKARAMLVEVDLTAICRDVYGNSNSVMKSAFKTTSAIDFYATASGANAGATAYSCLSKIWNNSTSAWDDLGSNTNTTIQKTTRTISSSNYISSSNKIYILLVAGYASDGTIASTLILDYINVRVDFTRTIDVINPIPLNLSNKWSLVIKGFSPAWENYNRTDYSTKIVVLYQDIQHFIDLTIISKKLFFRHNYNNTYTLTNSNNAINKKYQIHNILLTIDGNTMKCYLLLNNGSLEVLSKTIATPVINGLVNLYIGQFNNGTTQADGFIDSIYYLPNYSPSADAEAENILRGNTAGFENAELIYSSDFSDASKWTLNNGATISNNTLTLPNYNSTADQDVNVFPNNQYEVLLTKQGSMGVVEAKEYYNNIYIRSTMLGAGLNTFTTSPYTNKTKILLKNQLEGFSRNSVAYLSDGTQVPVNEPRFEQGKFGKALMIEEGTTNLFNNPFFINFTGTKDDDVEDSFTFWYKGAWNGAKIYAVSSSLPYSSTACKIDATESTSYNDFHNGGKAVSNGTTYTFSVLAGGTGSIDLYIYNNSPFELTTFELTEEPKLFSITYTSSGTSNTPAIRVKQGTVAIIYAAQLEAKPYATSFVDGTRAGEGFKIPTAGVLNPNEGTIEMRLKINKLYNWGDILITSPTLSQGRFVLFYDVNGRIYFEWSKQQHSKVLLSNFGVIKENTWQYIVVKWSGTNAYVYVDGSLVASGSIDASAVLDLLSLNRCLTFHDANPLLSDLRISNIARSDAEIAQAYASNAPLPIDQYTTYKLDFDSMSGAVITNCSMKLKM